MVRLPQQGRAFSFPFPLTRRCFFFFSRSRVVVVPKNEYYVSGSQLTKPFLSSDADAENGVQRFFVFFSSCSLPLFVYLKIITPKPLSPVFLGGGFSTTPTTDIITSQFLRSPHRQASETIIVVLCRDVIRYRGVFKSRLVWGWGWGTSCSYRTCIYTMTYPYMHAGSAAPPRHAPPFSRPSSLPPSLFAPLGEPNQNQLSLSLFLSLRRIPKTVSYMRHICHTIINQHHHPPEELNMRPSQRWWCVVLLFLQIYLPHRIKP